MSYKKFKSHTCEITTALQRMYMLLGNGQGGGSHKIFKAIRIPVEWLHFNLLCRCTPHTNPNTSPSLHTCNIQWLGEMHYLASQIQNRGWGLQRYSNSGAQLAVWQTACFIINNSICPVVDQEITHLVTNNLYTHQFEHIYGIVTIICTNWFNVQQFGFPLI